MKYSTHLKSTLAALATAIAAMAIAIESGNVVGYHSHQIVKGKNVFTTPFTSEPGSVSLAQSLGSLLESASEGDVIEFNGFKAEAVVIDGSLHWSSNDLVVDDYLLPSSDMPITYTRKSDETTTVTFAGEVNEAVFATPLTERPSQPIDVKEAPVKPRFFLTDILAYSTIRIECLSTNRCITGTGFFYLFSIGQGRNIPAIITNRHVVDGSLVTCLTFSTQKDGVPQYEKVSIQLPTSTYKWYSHQDPNVDLSYLPILPIIERLKRQGKEIYFIPYAKDFIPTAEELTSVTQLDDVAMIGYPNGLWDVVNNQPIFRKGSLATRPNNNYMGRREFLIDMPVYGGSSGSPILLINDTPFYNRATQKLDPHNRIRLLGVNYATHVHSATGTVEVVPIASLNTQSTNYMTRVRVPNNLGIVINASRILEIEDSLCRIYAPNTSTPTPPRP